MEYSARTEVFIPRFYGAANQLRDALKMKYPIEIVDMLVPLGKEVQYRQVRYANWFVAVGLVRMET